MSADKVNNMVAVVMKRANDLAPNSNFYINGLDGVKFRNLAQAIIEALTVDAQAADVGELPPLPHTDYNGYSDGSEPLYTADQMRDYARAALKGKQP